MVTHTQELLCSLIINYHYYEAINELLPICHTTEKRLWIFFKDFPYPHEGPLNFSWTKPRKEMISWHLRLFSRNLNPLQYFHGNLISEDFQLVIPQNF